MPARLIASRLFRLDQADVRNDDAVRVIIITGTGDRHFCTGIDVGGVVEHGMSAGNGPLIDEVFWISDATITKMYYISPAYERIWGRTCESVMRSPRSFLDAVHPDDRRRLLASLAENEIGRPYAIESATLLGAGRVEG